MESPRRGSLPSFGVPQRADRSIGSHLLDFGCKVRRNNIDFGHIDPGPAVNLHSNLSKVFPEVILVLDAQEGVVEQDLHVLNYALDAGAGMVVAVNKWDGLDADHRQAVKKALDRRLSFIPWVPLQMISALHGTGVGHLLDQVQNIQKIGAFEVSTSMLTRLLQNLVASHPAPAVRGRPIKLKVATRGGAHPPKIVVHGNQLSSLPASYRRFLENGFREALNLLGNPVKIELRDSDNPFAGRKNQLTQRQLDRRKRVIKHRKSKR